MTHVGSLPRTQEVVDLIFARENGQPFDQDEFDTVMTYAVSATVKKQVDAGVDIVSDGETSKISYATYVKDRYTGFSGDSPRNAPADLKMFPGFLKRLADDGGTPQLRGQELYLLVFQRIGSEKLPIHEHALGLRFQTVDSVPWCS